MLLNNRIEEIVRPIIEARNAFLVDINIHGDHGGKVVEIFLDRDDAVTSDLCADVSRDVSHVLDESQLIHGRYHLIVSSPGIDRPLKFLRQYPRNIGRTLTVKFQGDARTEQVTGKLAEVHDTSIAVQVADQEIMRIDFDRILDARVLISW